MEEAGPGWRRRGLGGGGGAEVRRWVGRTKVVRLAVRVVVGGRLDGWAQGGTAVGETGEGLEWGWGTLSLAEPLE